MLRVPVLWPSVLTSPEEVGQIKDLYAHLTGLAYSVEAWDAALQLYRTSKNPPSGIPHAIADRWRWIACHECIFELYHLRSRLEKIQSVRLRGCPSLRPYIDMEKIKRARKRLDEYFPDIEALRHATAHKGENEAHPEVHAPDGLYALTGFRKADRFSTPYQGKLRYLDITDQSLKRIVEVITEFVAAFEAPAAELEKQGHIE
ncbi:MAG: hypothetical protein V4625_01775 [Pseudomonadota bacterium]